ncbi:MAG: molybdenum cofactor biosynthesis protein MoaE [Nitrospinae bacterium]|nr:molybdenum cofactor biosynthesis protein MoaE [Nitrospinota bacterium]
MARLQRENFDIGAETSALIAKNGASGGTVAFIGTARDFSRGEKVVALEFEHYQGMAQKEMEKLEADAKNRFGVLDCLIIHRLGRIPAGENIVLIIAVGAHRPEAFDACEWLIDELKNRVPIWKKEIFVNGSHWVEPHP